MENRFQLCADLLKEMNTECVGVEVGVYSGSWSDYILGNTSIGKIYQIDPYKNFSNNEYKDAMNQQNLEVVFKIAKNLLSKYEGRHEFLRGVSEDFINKFENESLDVVYIDGNHAFEYAKKDIELWYTKVKKGGLLIGDDYVDLIIKYHENGELGCLRVTEDLALNGKNNIDYLRTLNEKEEYKNLRLMGEYGVKSAVNVFCTENNLTHSELPFSQWVIYK